MFSLQPSDDLVFGIPTTSMEDQIRDDLISDSNIISFGSSNSNGQVSQTANFKLPPSQRKSSTTSNIMKKAIHKEIERKRRLEMSNLHVSLASLLPSHHNKIRKGSASDEIEEAVNYIKQMQKNIQELRFRRDKLKELLSGSHVESSNGSDNNVTVNLVDDGLEILISSNSGIVLSRVLAELAERELDLVSCDSTTMEGKFICNIRVEANDMTCLDVLVLENGLTYAMTDLL